MKQDFVKEIKSFGADKFTACYDCGTCTAVCNLSEKEYSFPRYFVRLAKIGETDQILKSKELWLCYACGECSESCPRDADPANLIASLRRYVIANYEPTGLTKLMFKHPIVYLLITVILAVGLAFGMLSIHPNSEIDRWLFKYVSYETIHWGGIAMAIFMILSMIYGVIAAIRNYGEKGKNTFWQNLRATLTEIASFKRYQNCDLYDDSYWFGKRWYIKPWFLHFSIFWGFVGLFIATALDYLFKDPQTTTWLPSRIIGTIAGLMMMYGATVFMWYRLTGKTKVFEASKLFDWIFLALIWIIGFSGFWLEIAVFADANNLLTQIMFLVHLLAVAELFILFAFSKFAHAIYRPIALYFYFAKK